MRFILDIANKTESKPEMEKIIDFLSDEIATIHCIDESNSNQFYDEQEKNILTQKQIKTYNDIMMKKPTDIEELFTSLKPSKQNKIMTYQEIKQDINRKKKYEQLKELLNNHKTRSAWSKDMKKTTDRTDIEELFTSLKPSRKEQAIIWLISPVIVLATWALLIFICSL